MPIDLTICDTLLADVRSLAVGVLAVLTATSFERQVFKTSFLFPDDITPKAPELTNRAGSVH